MKRARIGLGLERENYIGPENKSKVNLYEGGKYVSSPNIGDTNY